MSDETRVQAERAKPIDRETVTVGEIEKLRPDSEYIKCYKALADQGHCKYDPNMRYADLPGLLHKHATMIAQLEALNMAFADVTRGVTLWDIGGLP